MLKFRLIARLDIRNDGLIRRIRCEGVMPAGHPGRHATALAHHGADELYFLDCVASLYGRGGVAGIVDATTKEVFVPVTVAGGIRTEVDVREMLNAGADKVCVNTAAVERPGLIDELSKKFGSSTICLQLDVKRDGCRWSVRTHGARTDAGRDAIEWATEAVDRGVGEIVATSIDRDGLGKGMDIDLLGELAHLPVPVVLGGGFSGAADAHKCWRSQASGVSICSALYSNALKLENIKHQLAMSGVPVRCESLLPGPVDS